jgi:tetratricopeptide (TPR) repeat protein
MDSSLPLQAANPSGQRRTMAVALAGQWQNNGKRRRRTALLPAGTGLWRAEGTAVAGGDPRTPNLVLRYIREEERRESREEFAAAVVRTGRQLGDTQLACDARLVARWEDGEVSRPRPVYQRVLAALTGRPFDQLGFLRRNAIELPWPDGLSPARLSLQDSKDRQPPTGSETASGNPPGSQDSAEALLLAATPGTLEEVLAMWDQIVGRRDLLARAGPAAGAALLASALPGALRSAGGTRPEVYAAHAALTDSYRQLDNLAGPLSVYHQVTGHHAQLSSWLDHAATPDEVRQVAALTADSGDLLAWLHFDLDDYAQAVTQYRESAEAARYINDTSLHAYLTGRLARTLSECRHHQDALAVADAAERIAGTSAAPAVRSWLAVTRSFDHARLGNETASRRDLDTAASLLARAEAIGEPAPGYIAFYGQEHLRKWAGHSMLALAASQPGLAAEGSRAVEQALREWPPAAVRESAELLAAVASARLAQREVDEAARLAGQAHAVARSTGSRRNLRAVTELRVWMRPFAGTRAVRELDERVRAGE